MMLDSLFGGYLFEAVAVAIYGGLCFLAGRMSQRRRRASYTAPAVSVTPSAAGVFRLVGYVLPLVDRDPPMAQSAGGLKRRPCNRLRGR
ncbi:hypothetical protein FHP25_08500 [Vineibacter terrae]|uniref:Uncharacterized protein n=1 Tax=Vineibacter terrae TaxID=2586908 RepID=A0A5C8PQY7_9HYPH|nr:hypothetical protein [Vineibacter terrae]TXL78227.1 hypothetical protein FHP25_08500 [Vineibacter terrae]